MAGQSALPRRLRDLRLAVGLSQAALAEPDFAVSYVSHIEAGRRRPSAEALKLFAKKVRVSPTYLATGVPDDLEASLRYRLEEARKANRDNHPAEAERMISPVLRQTEQYGLRRLRALLLGALAESLVLQGRMRAAVENYEAAMAEPVVGKEAAAMVGGLAQAYMHVGDLGYAAQLIERFLEATPDLDPSTNAELQAVLSAIYFEQQNPLRAERAARRALREATKRVSSRVRADVFWRTSQVLAEVGNWDEALELATRARLLAEQLDDTRSLARAHHAVATICLEGDPPRDDEASEHLGMARQALEKLDAPDDLGLVLIDEAQVSLLRRRRKEALERAEQGLALAPGDLVRAKGLFVKGRALITLRRVLDAEAVLKEAAETYGALGRRQQQALCLGELADGLLRSGDRDAAVKWYRSALSALDRGRSRS